MTSEELSKMIELNDEINELQNVYNNLTKYPLEDIVFTSNGPNVFVNNKIISANVLRDSYALKVKDLLDKKKRVFEKYKLTFQ